MIWGPFNMILEPAIYSKRLYRRQEKRMRTFPGLKYSCRLLGGPLNVRKGKYIITIYAQSGTNTRCAFMLNVYSCLNKAHECILLPNYFIALN